MTQEEKELLLRDLSARLLHHPILHFDEKLQQDDEYLYGFRENGGKSLINDAYYIEEVKPYLRPMSSMTEKESKEFKGFCDEFEPDSYWYPGKYILYVGVAIVPILIDWLNKHHFDYRGLIEKGLALEAPKGMYKIE